jgi:hypothetical protein
LTAAWAKSKKQISPINQSCTSITAFTTISELLVNKSIPQALLKSKLSDCHKNSNDLFFNLYHPFAAELLSQSKFKVLSLNSLNRIVVENFDFFLSQIFLI